MKWMLVITLCLSDGVDAECRSYPKLIGESKADCFSQANAFTDFILEAVEGQDVRVVFIGTQCEKGPDA
jgi:hypothetical protein